MPLSSTGWDPEMVPVELAAIGMSATQESASHSEMARSPAPPPPSEAFVHNDNGQEPIRGAFSLHLACAEPLWP